MTQFIANYLGKAFCGNTGLQNDLVKGFRAPSCNELKKLAINPLVMYGEVAMSTLGFGSLTLPTIVDALGYTTEAFVPGSTEFWIGLTVGVAGAAAFIGSNYVKNTNTEWYLNHFGSQYVQDAIGRRAAGLGYMHRADYMEVIVMPDVDSHLVATEI